MAKKYHIKCIQCDKPEVFGDEIDIRQAKWRIIAWNVKSGDPKCVCNKCEYNGVTDNDTPSRKRKNNLSSGN